MSSSSSSSAAAGVLLAHARPLVQRPTTTSVAGGGSYTAVFVVLGLIAALLVVSCLVGQVCAKKHLRPRPRRDRVAYYNDDVEFGAAKMEGRRADDDGGGDAAGRIGGDADGNGGLTAALA